MAAFTTCVRCGGKSFELRATTYVAGAQFQQVFVQCSMCGGAIAVLDAQNIGSMLGTALERLAKIENQLRRLGLAG